MNINMHLLLYVFSNNLLITFPVNLIFIQYILEKYVMLDKIAYSRLMIDGLRYL